LSQQDELERKRQEELARKAEEERLQQLEQERLLKLQHEETRKAELERLQVDLARTMVLPNRDGRADAVNGTVIAARARRDARTQD
jgi:hypothetical protein